MQILLETTDPYEFTTQNNTKDDRRADFYCELNGVQCLLPCKPLVWSHGTNLGLWDPPLSAAGWLLWGGIENTTQSVTYSVLLQRFSNPIWN